MHNRPNRTGFTLVEMLVVISIIGILMAMLLPAIAGAREVARKAQCLNNLRQIAVGVQTHHSRTQYMPPSRSWTLYAQKQNAMAGASSSTDQRFTWVQTMLSDLGDKGATDLLIQYSDTGAEMTYEKKDPLLFCPSNTYEGKKSPLSYGINGGRVNETTNNTDHPGNGVADDRIRYVTGASAAISIANLNNAIRTSRISLTDIRDGISTTILFGENTSLTNWVHNNTKELNSAIVWDHNLFNWSNDTYQSSFVLNRPQEGSDVDSVPNDSKYGHPSSRHTGGFQVAMCDGSARFINETVSYRVYCRLMTSDGRRSADPGASTPTSGGPVATNPDGWYTSQLKPISDTDL
jgi:prepilin-type N-terminal cleavage/methylation domain-containing protein/prepilin-type processing-associated H-X9-DG protein